MPQVNGQQFPYTPEGYQNAQQAQMASNGSPGLGGPMPMFGNSSMGQQMPMFGSSSMGQQPPMFGNTSMGMGQMQPMGRQPMGGQQRADDNPPGVPPEYEPYPGAPGYYMLPNPGGSPGMYKKKGPGMTPVDPVHFNQPKPGNWIEQEIDDAVGGGGVIGTQLYNLFQSNPMRFYELLQFFAPETANDIEQQVQQGIQQGKDKFFDLLPSANPLDWFKR